MMTQVRQVYEGRVTSTIEEGCTGVHELESGPGLQRGRRQNYWRICGIGRVTSASCQRTDHHYALLLLCIAID